MRRFNIDNEGMRITLKGKMRIYGEEKTSYGKYIAYFCSDNCKKRHLEKNPNEKEGCFIITAVCDSLNKEDDRVELMTFRSFRDIYMLRNIKRKNEVDEYCIIAPKIYSEIEKRGEQFCKEEYLFIWQKYLQLAFNSIVANKMEMAYNIYKTMLLDLKSEFISNGNINKGVSE
jgi:hypothetical protein